MTDEADETWPSKELRARANQQAQVLRDSATEGGLRFQAYVPPRLALWVLDQIERGVFTDPSEAVFVLLDEARELEPHLDMRQELPYMEWEDVLRVINGPLTHVGFAEVRATITTLQFFHPMERLQGLPPILRSGEWIDDAQLLFHE